MTRAADPQPNMKAFQQPDVEPMKIRTLRAGDEWDDALKIAAERGDSVPAMVRAMLRRYVKRHS